MYKYQAIAQKLREKFTDGSYQPGDLLPDQKSLANEFNTTRLTIRKAIEQLVLDEVVYVKRGAGTFLRKDIHQKKVRASVDKPVGASKTYAGQNVTSKILEFSARLPTEEEQQALLISANEPVYIIRRVRYIDDEVFAYEHTIMPTKLTTLTKKVLEGSIYKHLAQVNHLQISRSHRIISAAKATSEDVKAMGVHLNDPVLVIKQTSYTEEGEPFEYSETHFPYQTSNMVADVSINPLDTW
ncbi:GntR family transcriptional regulator [Lacticaseibacillus chiayiensis]|uniref:GntR family transcriptional regulator n=1 Tax=Lacticaseibacillus chiayiensis TaxID=2100821 RepID=UPI003C77CDD3